MLDDFFARALLAAIGVAVVAGPIGCVLLWKRRAYFGDTMAHSALLGLAIGVLTGLSSEVGVFVVVLLVAMAVVALGRVSPLASDTILGVFAHSTLALGLVTLSLADSYRVYDMNTYLFGDVLSVRASDVALIWTGVTVSLLILAAIWRPLVAATLHEGMAAAEGAQPFRNQLLYTALVAAVVAVGMKVVGVLLIVALMIVPAAAARVLSRTPEQMALLAAVLGVTASVLGLYGSLWLDTPSGPSIVSVAALIFLLCIAGAGVHAWLHANVRRSSPRVPEDDV